MKTAIAETSLDVWVHCPYCDGYQDVTEQLREELNYDLTSSDLENEIECDHRSCKKTFMVTDITY